MTGRGRRAQAAAAMAAMVTAVVAGGLVDAHFAGAAAQVGAEPGTDTAIETPTLDTDTPSTDDLVGELPDPLQDVVGDAEEVLPDDGDDDDETPTSSSSSTTTTVPPSTTTVPPEEAEEPEPEEEATEEESGPVADPEPFFEHARFHESPLPPAVLTLDPVEPPPLQTLVDFVDVAPGPRSTAEIVDLLTAAGATPDELRQVLAPFPVAGPARYSNDWGAPRFVPYEHPHEGTDIFASRGTPVIAPADGVITRVGRLTAIGGNSFWLSTPDGTYFYFSHLDGFVPAMAEGLQVEQGDVLGFVGTTGNAQGTPPHLHFEIHPNGGDPVPPLPYLDAWIDQAMARAQAFGGLRGTPVPVPSGPSGSVPSTPPLFSTPAAVASPAQGSPAAGIVTLGSLGASVWLYRKRRSLSQRLAGRFTMPSWWPRRPDPARSRIDTLAGLLEAREAMAAQQSAPKQASTVVDLDAEARTDEGSARKRNTKAGAGRR